MKKSILLFSLLFFGMANVFATHNLGGDISYTHITSSTTNYRYGITVRTFTNTAGTLADRCYLMVLFGDGDSAVAPRINGPVGTGVLCDAPYHDGAMVAGFSNVKENIYYIEHNYPGAFDYNISVSDPNRSNGICNIPSSVNTVYTFSATLVINLGLGVNSAPVYTSIPVRNVTVGVPEYYNPFVTESEGDSLYYEELVPYGVVGYTYPSFSTMFYIDNYTGMVNWLSPNTICNYVYDIKIKEYRNSGGSWYYIGSTMQEVWNTVSTMPAGITENTSDVNINVFPNPASDVINFRIANYHTTNDAQKYTLAITNSLGQMISKTDFTENTLTLNTENNLDKGVYFYEIRKQSELVQRGKFVLCGSSFK